MPHLSDREIARRTGPAPRTVACLRRPPADQAQCEVRIGADGRRRPVDGADGRKRAAEPIAANPSAPLREIARVAGVSLGTAHAVKSALRGGVKPVASGRDAGASRAAASVTGGAVRPASPGGPAHDTLRSVRKDPSLRFSDAEKELLRWLHAQDVAESQITRMAEVIPPHLLPGMAEIARHNAANWREFARLLRERWRQHADADGA